MTLQSVLNGIPRKNQIDRLVTRFKELAVGAIVEHKELAALIAENPESDRYHGIRGTARKLFGEQTGIWLQSVHGVGLRRPTGSEQLAQGSHDLRRHVRGIERTTLRIEAIPDSELPSEEDRAKKSRIVGRVKELALVARTEQKKITADIGKPEASPRMRIA